MEYKPHKQVNSFLEKNLSWYFPIKAWLTIALMALAQRELEWLKYWSHELPLIVDSSRGFNLLLSNSRKFLSFISNAWKVIFYCAITESQSCFLQKSQDNLYGKIGEKLKLLVSLSTKKCNSHFCLLGQFQNLMQLLLSSLKKSLSSWEIAVEWIWYRCIDKSKILLAVYKKSMMTTMHLMLGIPMAWLIPYLIAKSLVLWCMWRLTFFFFFYLFFLILYFFSFEFFSFY